MSTTTKDSWDSSRDSDRALIKRLNISYVAALLVVAILAMVIHILLSDVIEQQRDSSTIVNVAGRQRMLSQRIALLAQDLKNGDDSARELIKSAATLMAQSQRALEQGGNFDITNKLSKSAAAYYFEGPHALSPAVADYVAAAKTLSDSPKGKFDERTFAKIHDDARDKLLPALEHAVRIFEKESKVRIHSLEEAQRTVTILLLVTLLGEALLIFRPLVQKVNDYASRLYTTATRDALTGLPNRRFFLDTANRQVLASARTAEPLALMMLDVDHFKKINDTVGHAGGDAALRRLAQIMQESLRPTDTVGRLGGEEFAILLPETGAEDAVNLADRLRKEIERDRSEGVPSFTVSIGVAAAVTKDATTERLLADADEALYLAKNGGRNRVKLAPTFNPA